MLSFANRKRLKQLILYHKTEAKKKLRIFIFCERKFKLKSTPKSYIYMLGVEPL